MSYQSCEVGRWNFEEGVCNTHMLHMIIITSAFVMGLMTVPLLSAAMSEAVVALDSCGYN